jgi:hypothetical protein
VKREEEVDAVEKYPQKSEGEREVETGKSFDGGSIICEKRNRRRNSSRSGW